MDGKGNRILIMKRRISSFTLIELVMVMVIVVLAGTIVAPKLVDFIDKRTFTTEVEKLVLSIEEARRLAMANQANVKIFFKPDSKNYCVEGYPFSGEYDDCENRVSVPVHLDFFPDWLCGSENVCEIQFNASGEPEDFDSNRFCILEENPSMEIKICVTDEGEVWVDAI